MQGKRTARAFVLAFQFCLGLFSSQAPFDAQAAGGGADVVEIGVEPTGGNGLPGNVDDLESEGFVGDGLVVTRVQPVQAIRMSPDPTGPALSSARAGPLAP